ncbi:MAG: DUF1425 domain-containing protein [Phycisphaerales bacterium]
MNLPRRQPTNSAMPNTTADTVPNLRLRSVLACGTAVAALALLGACNTANTAQSGSGHLGSNVAFERIVTNGWLNYKANIVGVREGTVSDNVKKVAVDVYSDQATLQRFSYRFEWFDGSGLPVTNPTGGLTSVTIQPKETLTLTSVAPGPTATQWRLTFVDQKQ